MQTIKSLQEHHSEGSEILLWFNVPTRGIEEKRRNDGIKYALEEQKWYGFDGCRVESRQI